MKCVSALSTAAHHQRRVPPGPGEAGRGAGRETADLSVLFSSMHHADELGRIAAALLEQGPDRHVLGCTGESIVGEDREVEGSPALAVWSITLPGVTIDRSGWTSRASPASPGPRDSKTRSDPRCSFLAIRSRSGSTISCAGQPGGARPPRGRRHGQRQSGPPGQSARPRRRGVSRRGGGRCC